MIGYDDAAAAMVPLSSIHQPSREMGARATELLLAKFAGSTQRRSVRFQPTLVQRRSTRRVKEVFVG